MVAACALKLSNLAAAYRPLAIHSQNASSFPLFGPRMFAEMKDVQSQDNRTFVVTGLDGAPVTLNLGMIGAWMYNILGQSITFGFSLGFVSMLFIALLVLSPTDKLRKPIFLLSLVSQLLLAVRCITSIITFSAPYQGIGQNILEAMAQYPCSTYAIIFIADVTAVLLYGCILVLLILQVRAMFAAERRTRIALTTIGIIAAIVLQSFVVAWLVVNEYNRCHPSYPYIRGIQNWIWVYYTFRIYFVCFVGISCTLFLYKLAFTIYNRQKLCANMSQFGPLQITFIMFTQSLIFPREAPLHAK